MSASSSAGARRGAISRYRSSSGRRWHIRERLVGAGVGDAGGVRNEVGWAGQPGRASANLAQEAHQGVVDWGGGGWRGGGGGRASSRWHTREQLRESAARAGAERACCCHGGPHRAAGLDHRCQGPGARPPHLQATTGKACGGMARAPRSPAAEERRSEPKHIQESAGKECRQGGARPTCRPPPSGRTWPAARAGRPGCRPGPAARGAGEGGGCLESCEEALREGCLESCEEALREGCLESCEEALKEGVRVLVVRGAGQALHRCEGAQGGERRGMAAWRGCEGAWVGQRGCGCAGVGRPRGEGEELPASSGGTRHGSRAGLASRRAAALPPPSCCPASAPTWRVKSRERLTTSPHILRASSHLWYEVLVLRRGRVGGPGGGQGAWRVLCERETGRDPRRGVEALARGVGDAGGAGKRRTGDAAGCEV